MEDKLKIPWTGRLNYVDGNMIARAIIEIAKGLPLIMTVTKLGNLEPAITDGVFVTIVPEVWGNGIESAFVGLTLFTTKGEFKYRSHKIGDPATTVTLKENSFSFTFVDDGITVMHLFKVQGT